MAGNNVATALPGVVLASDEIDGIHFPVSKLAFGAEDEATLVSEENPLPVDLPEGLASDAKLDDILAKLSADPATQTTLAALLAAIQAGIDVAAAALPLPDGAASEATLVALVDKLPTLGAKAPGGSVSVTPSTDQDPIFDHANGTKTSVTASAMVITPPSGCKFIRISSDVDVFVNTAGAAAVDNGTSIRILANQPETIPVTAGVEVRALSSSGTAVVRCTPLKAR